MSLKKLCFLTPVDLFLAGKCDPKLVPRILNNSTFWIFISSSALEIFEKHFKTLHKQNKELTELKVRKKTFVQNIYIGKS